MDIRADFGKEFAINIGLFVTLGVSHAALVDLPQEHLRKAFIQFAEGFVQSKGAEVQGAGIHSSSMAMEAMDNRRR